MLAGCQIPDFTPSTAGVRHFNLPIFLNANKQKRLEFAKMCLENQYNFDNIIWKNDSSVQLKRHCQTMRVKEGREVPFKPVAKHALKVHVWAGISKRGATNI